MYIKSTIIAMLLFHSITHAQNFEKTFNTRNTNGQEYANAGIELGDGKYLIGIDNRILCLSKNGDSLWMKIYTGYGNIEKIFRDNNNNLMIASDIGKMIIARIDSTNGDTISSHRPPKQFSNSGYKIIDVKVLPGGDYLLLSRNGGPDGGSLMRYTPGSANFVWQNDYAGKSFKPTAMLIEDTTITLAGYYGAIDNWYFDLKLIKISTNNFPIWEKQYFRRLTYKDGTVGLVKNNQNQYLLASNLSVAGGQAPTIHVISNNGDSLAMRYIKSVDGKSINHANMWKIIPNGTGFYGTGMVNLTEKDPDGKSQASDRLAIFNINQSGEIIGVNQFNDLGFFKLTNTQYSNAGAWGAGCIATSDGYCLSYGTGNKLFPGTPGWLAQSVFKGYVVKTNVFKAGTVSINENRNTPSDFKIYPNPVNAHFMHIQTQQAGNFEVIDYSGRIVMTGKLQVGDNKIELPSSIVSGTYFVQSGNKVQKLIIDK